MADDLRGVEYLRRKLVQKSARVKRRYRFYEQKNYVRDLGISTPPELRAWNSALGWCAVAVDSLADRLVFREFRNDVFDMGEIYARNNPDVLFSSSALSALISSCSFIRIYRGEGGKICLENIDGGNPTGVIDPRTGLLTEGYAVLSRDDRGLPVLEAYFTPTSTTYIQQRGKPTVVEHPAGAPLLVPVINRPDAVRPFGHSRITRACMSYAEAAVRTIKRSEISAEFYSFPQKYGVGFSADREFDEDGRELPPKPPLDKWSAAMSAFIAISKDQDGDSPKLGQFQQASMEPHMAQLRMFASLFAGETGLTLDDLGFPSDNPSSQETIKASHENLRRRGKRAQESFSTGFLNAGYLAACLRDDYAYSRDALSIVQPVWEPLFEPDAAGMNLVGDGILKLNQAVPGFVTPQLVQDLTGLRGEVIQ